MIFERDIWDMVDVYTEAEVIYSNDSNNIPFNLGSNSIWTVWNEVEDAVFYTEVKTN